MPSAKRSPAKTRDKFGGHGKDFRIGGVTRQARPRPQMREVKGAAPHIMYADNSRTVANPEAYYAEENIQLGVRARPPPVVTLLGTWAYGLATARRRWPRARFRSARLIRSTTPRTSPRNTTQHASQPTKQNITIVTISPTRRHTQGKNVLDYWYMTDPEYWAKVRPGGRVGMMPGEDGEVAKKPKPKPKPVRFQIFTLQSYCGRHLRLAVCLHTDHDH